MFGIRDKRHRKVVGSLVFEQSERTHKGLIDRLHINVDFTKLFNEVVHRVLVFIVPPCPIGKTNFIPSFKMKSYKQALCYSVCAQ